MNLLNIKILVFKNKSFRLLVEISTSQAVSNVFSHRYRTKVSKESVTQENIKKKSSGKVTFSLVLEYSIASYYWS